MGQGYLEGGVALMSFTRDYGKGISIAPDFLLTATDSTGAHGSNVVTCKKKPPAWFELTKLAVGQRKETVTFEATWADAETLKTACGKGFPKPKEVFGTLTKGDAYVPEGFAKKGRVIIDLATRKVLPPGRFRWFNVIASEAKQSSFPSSRKGKAGLLRRLRSSQ
jgi:hypothetical protein